MPFPPIRHCLIAEDVRPEPGGKATILGFYGITPAVNIELSDFTLPLRTLAFLLIAPGGHGAYTIGIKLTDDRQVTVFEQPKSPLDLDAISERAERSASEAFFLVVSAMGMKFPHPGIYHLALLIDGKEHFSTTFEISLKSATQI